MSCYARSTGKRKADELDDCFVDDRDIELGNCRYDARGTSLVAVLS